MLVRNEFGAVLWQPDAAPTAQPSMPGLFVNEHPYPLVASKWASIPISR